MTSVGLVLNPGVPPTRPRDTTDPFQDEYHPRHTHSNSTSLLAPSSHTRRQYCTPAVGSLVPARIQGATVFRGFRRGPRLAPVRGPLATPRLGCRNDEKRPIPRSGPPNRRRLDRSRSRQFEGFRTRRPDPSRTATPPCHLSGSPGFSSSG